MSISKSEQLGLVLKDVEDAIALCCDPFIQSDLGEARIKMFMEDLNVIRGAIKNGEVESIDLGNYGYFRGPNPYDDNYKTETKVLFSSVLKVLNGIVFYRLMK